MVAQVAFLRAINVGGQGVLKMDALRAAFEAAGCRNVRTLIASGNVLFDGDATAAQRARIAKTVAAVLGVEPVIMYRTVRGLERLVADAPFGRLATNRTLKLYVMFAVEKSRRRPRFPLSLPKERLEAIGARNGDVFIVSRRKPNGWYGFPTLWIEKELDIVTTARTWGTVTKIVAATRTAQ
ncbi:MAG: DUF1697 domain-containing protein [Acidimicrobiia bacterium]|nr:DUF1697 domain-containing protein [Acidimicrobiia bacterium]